MLFSHCSTIYVKKIKKIALCDLSLHIRKEKRHIYDDALRYLLQVFFLCKEKFFSLFLRKVFETYPMRGRCTSSRKLTSTIRQISAGDVFSKKKKILNENYSNYIFVTVNCL